VIAVTRTARPGVARWPVVDRSGPRGPDIVAALKAASIIAITNARIARA
jgi:hypothetical protein